MPADSLASVVDEERARDGLKRRGHDSRRDTDVEPRLSETELFEAGADPRTLSELCTLTIGYLTRAASSIAARISAGTGERS